MIFRERIRAMIDVVKSFFVLAVRFLFCLTGLLWLGVVIFIARQTISTYNVPLWTQIILLVLMIIVAAVMIWLGLRVFRGNLWTDRFALLVVVVNSLVTFTDQVGAADLAYLIFSLLVAAVFIAAMFIRNNPQNPGG